MAHTLKELRALNDDRLIEEHDRAAKNTFVGVDYFLHELERRDRDRHDQGMLEVTRTMKRLTWMITALTAVNVIATAAVLFR